MFVSKRKYEDLERDLQYYQEKLEDKTEDLMEAQCKIRSLEYENQLLRESIQTSNIVPCSKVEEGSFVVNSSGRLRRVIVVNGNWVLNIRVGTNSLEVLIPDEFTEKFKGGPVSKEDLINHMIEMRYYNG